MKKFYLVARGKFNNEYLSNPDKYMGLISSHNGLINTDYMGSAEFEWGAIPRFYRRVMQNFDQYKLINLKNELDIKTINGVPFHAFVNNNDIDDFHESIFDYISDLMDTKSIRKWRLKEYTGIEKHLFRPTDSWDKPTSNIWYCIDNTDEYIVGNWFMFVGAQDRVNAFLKCLKNDYNNWWINLPEEERVKDYSSRY